MNGDLVPIIAGGIFCGIGALLIGSLLGFLVQRVRVMHSMGRTLGRVVAIETLSATAGKQTLAHAADVPPPDPRAQRYYRSVVEYAVDGKSYQVQGAYATQRSTTTTTIGGNRTTFETVTAPLDEDTGQTVAVGYSRSNPAEAYVINTGRDLQVAVMQIFFGMMFMIIGLLAFYVNGNLAWIGPDWHR